MRTLRTWPARIRGFFRRDEADQRLAAEIESHLQLHIDDNIRAGMSPDEARRAALLKFGPFESIKAQYRDRSSLPFIEATGRDIRFAFRSFSRQPGFAVAAAATLAIGIAATTAVFSVINQVLLRPLPYSEPSRVVRVQGPSGQFFARFGPFGFDVHPPEVKESRAFDSTAMYGAGAVNVGGAPAVRVRAAEVTADFFAVLGVSAVLGRTFTQDDVERARAVVVLGHRLWQERYGADPAALGRTITLDGAPHTIIGVVPAGVEFPEASLLWVPASAPTQITGSIPAVTILARLAPGVTAETARAEIMRVTRLQGKSAGKLRVEPLQEALVGAVRPVAGLVWAAALLILLVACINTANLLLARVAGRHREFAVRRAIGATRIHLVRLVIVESVVLALIAGAASIPATIWILDAARALLPATLHGAADIRAHTNVFVLTGMAALVTAVLFGLGPALSIPGRASADVLRTAASTTLSAGWRRFRSVLLVAEVAIAVALLASAITLARHVNGILSIDLGARGERAIVMEIHAPRARYKEPARLREFFVSLDQSVRAVAGVEAAGVTNMLPGRAPDMMLARALRVVDRPGGSGQASSAVLATASPGYFNAAGIDILAGREFNSDDRAEAQPVLIVSEGYAREMGFSPSDLVEAHVVAGRPPGSRARSTVKEQPARIVGVVRDVRLLGPETPLEPMIYATHAAEFGGFGPSYLVVRTSDEPWEVIPAIRAAVASVDPDIPLYNVQTFDEMRALLLGERRFAMATIGGFAVLALILSTIGLYGVINYLVQSRTREIGIRLAIGASRAAVRRQVLGGGLMHATAGTAAGVLAVLVGSRWIASRVPAAADPDAATLALLAAGSVAVALAATWIPAARATRIDPAVTLRVE